MTSIHLDHVDLLAGRLGPISQVPSLDGIEDVVALPGDGIPESVLENMRYGRVAHVIPYRMRDDYGRERALESVPVAVIENDRLRATVLVTMGGRLWSLYDKEQQRELLYQSPALQPVNFGLANAWFAGGIEWNISTIGHSPFAFSPMHVVVAAAGDGTPILRLYEFERLRETPFQIDLLLADDPNVLLVRVRIRNPTDREQGVYWWSNIAVPERPDLRVVAPADSAFRLTFDGKFVRVPFPSIEARDASYPAAAPDSASYYFDIPEMQPAWVAAIDSDGYGLVHTSTTLLRGRKFFTWGQSPGGHRWQEFLSEPGHPYFEVQAGLAQTQLEQLPLRPGSSWSWVEAIGPIALPAGQVFGTWHDAVSAVDQELMRRSTKNALESRLQQFLVDADAPIIDTLHLGSGWGALEEIRRRAQGLPGIATPGMPFPQSSIGPDQAPWIELVESGSIANALPSQPPSGDPGHGWRDVLERSHATWATRLQLGVARFASGDDKGARSAWVESIKLMETAWAHRCIAVLDSREARRDDAVDRLSRAAALAPGVRILRLELLRALLSAGRHHAVLERIGTLPDGERSDGRIRLLELEAAIGADDLDRASGIFASDLVVPDLREGDRALENLWNELQQKLATKTRPADGGQPGPQQPTASLPARYDFRMSPR